VCVFIISIIITFVYTLLILICTFKSKFHRLLPSYNFIRALKSLICTVLDEPLPDFLTLLESLKLDEFLNSLDASGLSSIVADVNLTVFAPTNEAMQSLFGNVSEVSPGLTRQVR